MKKPNKTIDKLKQKLLCNPKIKMIAFNFPQGTSNTVSLSDILEEQVDPKYFLSEKAVTSIMGRLHKGTTLHTVSKQEETSTGAVI